MAPRSLVAFVDMGRDKRLDHILNIESPLSAKEAETARSIRPWRLRHSHALIDCCVVMQWDQMKSNMFQASRLPRVSFFGGESEKTLDLSQCSGSIRHVAEIVSQLAPASHSVGLIFRTGPELVVSWLGVLATGRVPLILQYPTSKISKVYWRDSVRDSVSKCGIGRTFVRSRTFNLCAGGTGALSFRRRSR